MPDTCATCRFWDRYDGKTGQLIVGDCRRYPPRIVEASASRSVMISASEWISEGDLYEASCFPVSCSDSSCGEYQPRQPGAPLC